MRLRELAEIRLVPNAADGFRTQRLFVVNLENRTAFKPRRHKWAPLETRWNGKGAASDLRARLPQNGIPVIFNCTWTIPTLCWVLADQVVLHHGAYGQGFSQLPGDIMNVDACAGKCAISHFTVGGFSTCSLALCVRQDDRSRLFWGPLETRSPLYHTKGQDMRPKHFAGYWAQSDPPNPLSKW